MWIGIVFGRLYLGTSSQGKTSGHNDKDVSPNLPKSVFIVFVYKKMSKMHFKGEKKWVLNQILQKLQIL